MRHLGVIAAVVALLGTAAVVSAASDPAPDRQVHPVSFVVHEGESWQDLADLCGNVTADELATLNWVTDHNPLYDPPVGAHVVCLPGEPPTTTTTEVTTSTSSPSTSAATSTTLDSSAPGTTTLPPTTTASTSSSSTSTASTTAPPPPSTTTTTPPEPGVQFEERFTGNTGEDRFHQILDHRSDTRPGTWTADHDMACSDPTTQRTVRHDSLDEQIFECRDHVMQTMGDVSGYSVVAMCPDVDDVEGCDGFTGSSVSWDVNVTNLHGRQWWEVKIVPVDAADLSVIAWLAAENGGPAHLPVYPEPSVVIGNGPAGGDFHAHAAGQDLNPSDWQHVCDGSEYSLGGGACDSKATRLPFKAVDNRDGTITLNAFGQTYTFNGAFPPVYKVVIASHAYTPLKDGPVPGHTWHFDNIAVTD
jgi:hypothetical protein